MVKTPRELAYGTLLAAEQDNSRSIDDLLSAALRKSSLSPQDKRWSMELIYGVTRMRLQLDALIQATYKGRYRKAQHAIKVLLRMGAFQLKYMQTADHAAIHETVSLSKQVKQNRASGLVNAILRKIQNLDLDQIVATKSDRIERLAIQGSHPEWLLSRWVTRYSTDDIIALCDHNNKSPKVWIRRNALRVEQPEFENFLQEEHVSFKQSDLLNSFYEIDSGASLLTSVEFSKGWFSFQDIAAGVVASLINPQAGETIVDACAAPGGKMAFISELSGGAGLITACDASNLRLDKVRQNIERLQLEHVKVLEVDATCEVLPTAEKILLDVPCSGTGVLGRRPDARWKRQDSDIAALAEIQTEIIKNSWNYLQPGGLLVYATCTLEPEENWGVIDSIIGQLNNAEIETIKDEKLKPYIDERGALATLPWRHSMDGMFAVKIRKTL